MYTQNITCLSKFCVDNQVKIAVEVRYS